MEESDSDGKTNNYGSEDEEGVVVETRHEVDATMTEEVFDVEALGLRISPPSLKKFEYVPRNCSNQDSQYGLVYPLPKRDEDFRLSNISVKVNVSRSFTSASSLASSPSTPLEADAFSPNTYWNDAAKRKIDVPSYLFQKLWKFRGLPKRENIRPSTDKPPISAPGLKSQAQLRRISHIRILNRLNNLKLSPSGLGVCLENEEEIQDCENSLLPNSQDPGLHLKGVFGVKLQVDSNSNGGPELDKCNNNPDGATKLSEGDDKPERLYENTKLAGYPGTGIESVNFTVQQIVNQFKQLGEETLSNLKSLIKQIQPVSTELRVDNALALSLLALPWHDELYVESNSSREWFVVDDMDGRNYVHMLAQRNLLENDWRNTKVEESTPYPSPSRAGNDAVIKNLEFLIRQAGKKKLLGSPLNRNSRKESYTKIAIKRRHLARQKPHLGNNCVINISPNEFNLQERILMLQVEKILAGHHDIFASSSEVNQNPVQKVDMAVCTRDLPTNLKQESNHVPLVGRSRTSKSKGGGQQLHCSEVFRKYEFVSTSSTQAEAAKVNSQDVWTSPLTKTNKKARTHDDKVKTNKRSREIKNPKPKILNVATQNKQALAIVDTADDKYDFIVGPPPKLDERNNLWDSKFVPKWFRKSSKPGKLNQQLPIQQNNNILNKKCEPTPTVSNNNNNVIIEPSVSVKEKKKLWEPKHEPVEKLVYTGNQPKENDELLTPPKPQRSSRVSKRKLIQAWKLSDDETTDFLTNLTSSAASLS